MNNNSKNLGKYALILGVIFFISVVASYVINFMNIPISKNPENWGVFGDYIGGLVNPLIGLVTIWLLTVSLRQNQDMLEQAQSELKLAIAELKRNQEIQHITEQALREQVSLAQSARDLDGTIALINYWVTKHNTLIRAESDEVSDAIRQHQSEAKIARIKEKYTKMIVHTLDKATEFDHILEHEEKRLLKRYPPLKATFK